MAVNRIEDATFEELLKAWVALKQEEKNATAKRVNAEKAILSRLDAIGERLPDEGDRTFQSGGLKVTLSSKLNRRVVNKERLMELAEDIPEEMRPWHFEEVIKLEAAGFRYIAEKEPGLARLLAEAVEEKPAKVGVKVTEATKEDEGGSSEF